MNDSILKKIILISLLLMIISKDYNITDIKILLSVIILTFIVNFYLNDFIYAFMLSVLIISILFVINKCSYNQNITENFDSIQKIEKDYKKVNKNKDSLTKESIKLINLDPASDSEDEDKELNKDKKIEDYSPADAQKETYRMIDTVKQLKTTVETLAPTIKEGRKILEAFKKLDLNINDVK
jgi:hypothetical protein